MSDLISSLNLIDLHIHVGASVAPHILWKMAHEQGFRLPAHNYWEFQELVTASPGNVKNLDDYLKIMHEWTERIQSSPLGVEQSVYEIISKEYRGSNVTAIELRFNPMKRNNGGVLDLDHIIHAALRGMDRVCLEYGVEAGLIFCLAREFDAHRNEILVEKAIRYHDRGVIGIDLAGPESRQLEDDVELMNTYGRLFRKAREHGLSTTIHTGETTSSSPKGMSNVIKLLKPHRMGHGIRAAFDPQIMQMLKDEGIVLELCPTSNLLTHAVSGLQEMGEIIQRFDAAGVRYTVNTDGTYLLKTNLRKEFQLLIENRILDEKQVKKCLEWAKQASFIKGIRFKAEPAQGSSAASMSEED